MAPRTNIEQCVHTLLSRCGLGPRPGRQLLRLRADPAPLVRALGSAHPLRSLSPLRAYPPRFSMLGRGVETRQEVSYHRDGDLSRPIPGPWSILQSRSKAMRGVPSSV